MHVLVTGAGIVGSEAVRVLLSRRLRVSVLLRGSPAEHEQKALALRAWVGPHAADALDCVPGNIELAELGLESRARAGLADVTHVLHVAACTSLLSSREQAQAANVAGTAGVLAFARQLPRLAHLAHVSTAYLDDQTSGLVYERPLPEAGVEFHTEYARSKAQAEALVLRSELPASICRLSLVLGRLSDGHLPRMNDAPYALMRLLRDGLLSMFPSAPGQRVDMLPLDFAAESLVALLLAPKTATSIYHVAAGKERSPTIAEYLGSIQETLTELDPSWARRGLPAPLAVPREVFARYVQTMEEIAGDRLRSIARKLEGFTRPIQLPKDFDRSQFESKLGPLACELPHARSWLPRVIAHAFEVDFRGDVSGPARRPGRSAS